MISRKELAYVYSWARSVPYPGDTYSEEAMEKLKDAFNLFNERYNNTKYNIIFSNNEEIDLEIKGKNLAHMLGIDFKNLSNDVFLDFRKNVLGLNPEEYLSSYALLKAIIENSDKVIDFDKNSDYLKAINYYKISIKSDIFSKLGDLTNFNYACINFDKPTFMKNVQFNFNPKSNKFLYLPSGEAICPYFFMGILQENDLKIDETKNDDDEEMKVEDTKPYIVETLIAPDDPKQFFQNQEIIIPTQILRIKNKEMLKFPANPSQKIQLLKEYENIIRMYDIQNKINIYSDYIATLTQEEEKAKKLEKVL